MVLGLLTREKVRECAPSAQTRERKTNGDSLVGKVDVHLLHQSAGQGGGLLVGHHHTDQALLGLFQAEEIQRFGCGCPIAGQRIHHRHTMLTEKLGIPLGIVTPGYSEKKTDVLHIHTPFAGIRNR